MGWDYVQGLWTLVVPKTNCRAVATQGHGTQKCARASPSMAGRIDVWSMAIMLVELFHRSQHVAESATAQQIAVFRVPTTHWRGLAVLAYMCPPCCLMLCLPSGSVLSTCFFSCFPFLSSFLFPFWSPFLLPFLSPFFVLLLAPVPFFFASLCPIVVLLFVVISSFLHGFYWELSCLMASLSQGLPYCVSFLVSLPPPIIAKTNTNP